MLHAQGVSLNDQLRVASSEGQLNKVLELLEAGASFDVDGEGRTALHLSAQFGHDDVVAALILAGSNVNKTDFAGRTALQRASAEGHVTIVQQLLKHGARVDHQDEVLGNTALHEAAWKGYSFTLEALCKVKANVYIKNKGGFAPLHLACQNGHNQSCRVLLLAGCKPDIKNNYGDTPLHTSARYGHAGVMRILISALCKVSEPNKNSDTALHISVAMGRRKLTRILLEAKCNADVQNKQGETAMDIAKRKEFTEIQSILQTSPAERVNVQKASEKSHKKREKDSGTSSKESGHKHKDKHKKSKKGHKVHFPSEKDDLPKWSPYGCHFYPNTTNFPPPKLDSLPKEPLTKGEQYYLDLSGNIRKGPVGRGYACYCAPFFQHVEQKLEVDKQELIDHIDLARADLHERMINLEKRTKGRLVNLGQLVQEKLAAEQMESWERSQRRAQKDREMLEQQENSARHIRTELQNYVGTKLREFERKHYCHHNPRDVVDRSFMVKDKKNVKRYKSEELLSERAKSASSLRQPEDHFQEENANHFHRKLNGSANHVEELDHCKYYSPQEARRGLEADFDAGPQGSQDSGYNAAQGNATDHRTSGYSLNATLDSEDVPEFKMTGQFFDTVSNEMEKWYERRLVAIEKKAEEKLLVNNEEIQERIQAIEEQLTKINDSLSHSSASRSESSLV